MILILIMIVIQRFLQENGPASGNSIMNHIYQKGFTPLEFEMVANINEALQKEPFFHYQDLYGETIYNLGVHIEKELANTFMLELKRLK